MSNYNDYLKKLKKINIYSKCLNKEAALDKSVKIIRLTEESNYKDELIMNFIKIFNKKYPCYEWLKHISFEDSLMFIPLCLEKLPCQEAYYILNSIIKDKSNNKYNDLILDLVKILANNGYFNLLEMVVEKIDLSYKYSPLYKKILDTIDDTVIKNCFTFSCAYNYVSQSRECKLFQNTKDYLIGLAKLRKEPHILLKLSEMQKTNNECFDIDKNIFINALEESNMSSEKKEQMLFEYGIKYDSSVFDKFNSLQEFLGYIYLLNIPKDEKSKLVDLAINNIGGKYVDDIINSYEEKEMRYADQLENELDKELNDKVRLMTFKNKERKEN